MQTLSSFGYTFFAIFFFTKTSQTPFDIAENGSEFNTEYGGAALFS